MRTVCAIAWWAGWLLLSMVPRLQATETVTLYVTNAQGTVVAEMTPQGQVTYEATYRPYGKQVTGVPQAGPGYTGHVNDLDSGLVYMQARYYDPDLGRFLSMDPMGPSAGNGFNFNRYAYADNSPAVNTDPTGMCSQPGVPDPVCPQPQRTNPPPPPPPPLPLFRPMEGPDIFHVAGKAIATDIAYLQGLITGNQTLMSEAVEGFSKDIGTKTALATVFTLGTMGRGGAPEAIAPVGRLGRPLYVPRGTNRPDIVDGIEYSGHAFDQMQGRGLTPSVVRNILENGTQSAGRGGATVYYDSVNNITIIINASGRVITVYPGGG